MLPLKNIIVAPEDAEIRLDRWFKAHYPGIKHGELQRLLRTGQVRVDGKRAKANLRLAEGMEVRVPPLARAAEDAPPRSTPKALPVAAEDAADLRRRILCRITMSSCWTSPPDLPCRAAPRPAAISMACSTPCGSEPMNARAWFIAWIRILRAS